MSRKDKKDRRDKTGTGEGQVRKPEGKEGTPSPARVAGQGHANERLHQFEASRLPQGETAPLCSICGVRHRPEDAQRLHAELVRSTEEGTEKNDPNDSDTKCSNDSQNDESRDEDRGNE